MTALTATALRAIMFGDPDGQIWACVLDAGAPAFVAGVEEATIVAVGAREVHWSLDGGGVRVAGDRFDLRMEPAGEAPDAPPGTGTGAVGEVGGYEELCRVRGTILAGATEHAVDCVGTHWLLEGVDLAEIGSLRAVSGWFGPDRALALLSLRARRASGHESDLVAATLFDPEGWIPVNDPRLSTTYADSGVPARAGLELWIGEGEDEYPRRATGEAIGEGALVECEGLHVRVTPLRCHGAGREGAGVYVLATFDER
jgi:hypothetical protein